jgi:hypothetical protein
MVLNPNSAFEDFEVLVWTLSTFGFLVFFDFLFILDKNGLGSGSLLCLSEDA